MEGNPNEERRTVDDYARAKPRGNPTSIVRPPIQQEQFVGHPSEDPHLHIQNFLTICGMIRMNGVSDEAIRLSLFPFSLRDKAKSWLLSQPEGSITTWDDLESKFLTSCPYHELPEWLQLRTFDDGLNVATKTMVDAAARGSFAQKTLEEARQLIELNSLNAKFENMKFEGNKLVHYVAPISQEEYNEGTSEDRVEYTQQQGAEQVAEQQPEAELEIAKEEEEEKIPPKQKLVVDEAYWNRSKKQILGDSCKPQIPPLYVKLPYPHIPKNKGKEEQFSKFLDIFRKLHINISFAEALEQMPLYAKFIKDLLLKKRKLKKDATIALTEKCSAILQQKLPHKLKDPRSFSIPCTIGNVTIGKTLCDLGAGINLMPLSILKKLGVGEVKSTKMALQLADRSIKYPYGVMEDVLLKVDKLIFPTEFVILDMDEDSEVPVILGRPFLATGRALIDVQQGQLMLRVHDEKVTFKVFEAMQHPNDEKDTCFRMDMVDSLISAKSFGAEICTDPLKKTLVNVVMNNDEEVDEEL
ncbi:uncharacterized protein LOC113870454 [Abrus precatorius]|uniref:Uncharacterized protein LOC113870454 n=1 Tax=Abrus precatorius TaxID=3816 RepID=A0A8B8M547_ABRPR|nr:uncharacterized protein LOC113870454 [Abrus precatorius]